MDDLDQVPDGPETTRRHIQVRRSRQALDSLASDFAYSADCPYFTSLLATRVHEVAEELWSAIDDIERRQR